VVVPGSVFSFVNIVQSRCIAIAFSGRRIQCVGVGERARTMKIYEGEGRRKRNGGKRDDWPSQHSESQPSAYIIMLDVRLSAL
jgi:hypothetical protein